MCERGEYDITENRQLRFNIWMTDCCEYTESMDATSVTVMRRAGAEHLDVRHSDIPKLLSGAGIKSATEVGW